MGSQTLTLPPRTCAPALTAKIVLFCAIALGIGLNFWMAVNNSTGWGEDFNQFYSASRLAGTGQMYNWELLRKIENENGSEVPTGRLPVVIYGSKLITWLPYSAARMVWLIASLLALAIFLFTWPGVDRRMMAVALAWSMAAGLLLVLGQDTPFWLMLVSGGLLLLQRGYPRVAGVLFALCICKFHLTLGIPILLIAQKRWSALLSACVTGALLVAACFAIEGPGWPAQYMVAYRQPSFSPAEGRMPNLCGLSSWFSNAALLEVALALAVAALLWVICRRTPDLGIAGALTVAAGLLLAHHCYANDCALLIPLLVFTMQRREVPRWLKMAAVLLFTPVPIFLVTTNRPYFGQILVVGFVFAALIFEATRRAIPSTPAPAI